MKYYYRRKKSYNKLSRRRVINFQKKPFSHFIPNILTLAGMCCGVTGIHMSLTGNFVFAITAILLAAFFDGIDGRVARKLGATSKFGAELDSLSDFATFGITPSIIVYMFSLHEIGKIGWAISLLFSMSMALRLARFNITNTETSPRWQKCFAIGMPAPIAAYMFLWPIMIGYWLNISINPILYSIWGVIAAGLTISKIPTFLLKSSNDMVSQQTVKIILVSMVVLLGIAYSYTWFTLVLIGFGYIISIFISSKLYRKHKTMNNL